MKRETSVLRVQSLLPHIYSNAFKTIRIISKAALMRHSTDFTHKVQFTHHEEHYCTQPVKKKLYNVFCSSGGAFQSLKK